MRRNWACVTASNGLTTWIKPDGDRSRLQRTGSEAEIDIPANKYFTGIQSIDPGLHQTAEHQQQTLKTAVLDTLTRLTPAPESSQPNFSDAQ